MKTNLKKLLSLCLAGIVTAGMAISASAVGVFKVTTNNEIAGNEAVLSIDLDDSRIWHTDWVNGPFEPPFILTYELDEVCEISSIGLYPRQDSNLNGLPYALNINVSDDGVNFTTVEEVDWLEYTYDLQTVELKTPVTTKYLQLEILDTEGYEFASLNQLYINGEAVTISETVRAAKQAIIDNQIADGVDVVYGTPVIDGEIDDVWANVPGYKAEYIYLDAEAKSVCDPTIKFMWDESQFYVLFEVKDEQLNALTDTLWANDNLQIFMDFGHGHDFAANNYNGDGSAIGIRYCWLGGVVELPAGFTVELLGGGGNIGEGDARYDNIVKAQKTVDGGWVCEIAFDPTVFAPDFKMVEGAQGGIDYVVDDTNIGNNSGSRDTLYVFSINSETWNSSANLIPFTFVKTEAPAETAPETEAPVVETEAPAAAETVTETVEVPAAPQTFDFGVIAAIAAVISAAGYAVTRRRV